MFAHTRFTVHGLTKDKRYVFRVKSVGRARNSEYSEESDPVVVKSAICEYLTCLATGATSSPPLG